MSEQTKEGELEEGTNMQKVHIGSADKPIAEFSLDVIISVGYRVKSQYGVRFRQWANQVLKAHLTRGDTLNRPRFCASVWAAFGRISAFSAPPCLIPVSCVQKGVSSRFPTDFTKHWNWPAT